jgi:hypothetical protein
MEIYSDPFRLNMTRSLWRTRQQVANPTKRAAMQGIARSNGLHSQLYRAAVELGKVNAERDPTSCRKVVRRRVLRASNGVVQRGLRRVGLWR